MTSSVTPRRGEIWVANLGDPPRRHWVVIVSLDYRNLSDRSDSVLIVPFTSRLMPGPSVLRFEPGESGLDQPSCLRGQFISTINKSQLMQRQGRPLNNRRMRELCLAIRRSFDPDAPAYDPNS